MTPDIEITLHRPALLSAVSLCVSKEETRYYLGGVYVQPSPWREGVVMVATDGHRMAIAWDRKGTIDGTDRDGNGGVILSFDKPNDWNAFHKRGHERAIIDGDRVQLTDPAGNALDQRICGYIDGSYPDWSRILPSGPLNGTSAPLNGEYLASFATAAKRLGSKGLTFSASGPRTPHLVTIGDPDFFGVLMPMPEKAGDASLPDWVSQKAALAA